MATSGWFAAFHHTLRHLGISLALRDRSWLRRRVVPGSVRNPYQPMVEVLESRLTPDTGFTEFSLPTANSLPLGMTAGPDGALWFTEFNANQIGRITTGGTVTEFAVPTLGSQPGNITAGPDG